MKNNENVKVGLLCVGLNTYWSQFEGLFQRLMGYHHYVGERIKDYDVNVIDAGMIDSFDKAEQASELI